MRARNKADSGQNFHGRAGSSWGAEKKHNDNEHGACKRKRLEKRGSNRKNRARASQRELEKAVPRRKGLPVLRCQNRLIAGRNRKAAKIFASAMQASRKPRR